MQKRIVQGLVAAGMIGGLMAPATTAWAGHDHYIVTPNGRCHQVAPGQTGIGDPNAGGYHQFHDHVHLGATGGTSGAPYQLGDGHARVVVYKDDCVAP